MVVDAGHIKSGTRLGARETWQFEFRLNSMSHTIRTKTNALLVTIKTVNFVKMAAHAYYISVKNNDV